MGISRIIRVGQFMRFFESIERKMRIADKEDVKFTLAYVQWRNSTGQTKSADGSLIAGPAMPKSLYWHPEMSKSPNTQEMTKEERADYYDAYSRIFSKFAGDKKYRGVVTA